MNKKNFTLLFLFVSTIINVIFTILVIGILLVGSSLLLRYVFHTEDPNVIMADWMVCFIGGMILSLYIYSKISDKVVVKYKLADKIDDRLTGRRFSHFSENANKEQEKPKTVMPKSVLPDEDENWKEDK